LSQIPESHL
jgi:hypothetical protein